MTVILCTLLLVWSFPDFHQVLSIADESLEVGDKLVITLFYKSMKEFPSVSVGDVIRFHRLEVSKLLFFEDKQYRKKKAD